MSLCLCVPFLTFKQGLKRIGKKELRNIAEVVINLINKNNQKKLTKKETFFSPSLNKMKSHAFIIMQIGLKRFMPM